MLESSMLSSLIRPVSLSQMVMLDEDLGRVLVTASSR